MLESERGAATATAAHDATRAFHVELIRATGNETLLRIFDGLWIADVGRRLLASRRSQESWQSNDVAEHEAILAAVEAGDADAAETLMREHVGSAWQHWSGASSARRLGLACADVAFGNAADSDRTALCCAGACGGGGGGGGSSAQVGNAQKQMRDREILKLCRRWGISGSGYPRATTLRRPPSAAGGGLDEAVLCDTSVRPVPAKVE